VTIGLGTPAGPDTYEAQWNTTALAAGDYSVRAILATDTSQVAQDEEQVKVDNSKESAELTYPVIGSAVGVYDPVGPAKAGFVVETTTSTAIKGTDQQGHLSKVRIMYSTSVAGTEPSWKGCSEQRTVLYSDDPLGRQRIGCVVQGESADSVRLIAALPIYRSADKPIGDVGCPTGCPGTETVHSADAHRVTTYTQTPSTIAINSDGDAGVVGQCEYRTAIVVDGSGRPIWRANVDVHASGPSDQLQFGSGDRVGKFQKPDKGHPGEEPTAICQGTAAGKQGDHDVLDGLDTKHIEAAVEGTGVSGDFVYALESPDSTGSTVDVVWVDGNDDDDLTCGEVAGSSQFEWGPPPTPTQPPQPPAGTPTPGVPQCATPTPSTSPTLATPTPSSSATSTGSPTPGPGNQQITLGASKKKIVSGRKVTLSGQLSSTDPLCIPSGVEVTLERRVFGTHQMKTVATASTDVGGNYSYDLKGTANADYIARAPAHDTCVEATSSPVSVLARARVIAEVTDKAHAFGSDLTIAGSVLPKHASTKVILQRREGDKWIDVTSEKTDKLSKFHLTIKVSWHGVRALRVKWPSADKDHATGVSGSFKVKV
jgi:hypothetical protein